MNPKGIGTSNNCLQSEVKLFIQIYFSHVCFFQKKTKKKINQTNKLNIGKKIQVKIGLNYCFPDFFLVNLDFSWCCISTLGKIFNSIDFNSG